MVVAQGTAKERTRDEEKERAANANRIPEEITHWQGVIHEEGVSLTETYLHRFLVTKKKLEQEKAAARAAVSSVAS